MFRALPLFRVGETVANRRRHDGSRTAGDCLPRVAGSMILAALLAVAASCGRQPSQSGEHPVLAILRDQQSAWNDGDIERFMQHYWKSDRLTFSSTGKTTRGWENTLADYRRRYPSVEKMGNTRFENLEVFPLGDKAALVLGQWFLTRQPDPLKGNFSVVFQQIEGRWVIIHDHTSRATNGTSLSNVQATASLSFR